MATLLQLISRDVWTELDSQGRERAMALGVLAAALSCFALAFFIYWPGVDSFFVWDDFFFLNAVRNHSFLEGMYRAFTFPRAEPLDEVTPFWRPSIDLYFYAAKPFGINPQPLHIVNIVLHGTVGALAVVFVWRLTRSAASGAISGLLFTVAPTYDYAVSWISQVSELLGMVFILAAIISWHAWLIAERTKRSYLVLTAVFAVLALLTKESTVILILLLPALTLAVPREERRPSWTEIARGLAFPLMLGLTFAVAMLGRDSIEGGDFYTDGLNMARNLWRYLKWMVFPYQAGSWEVARAAGAAIFMTVGVGALLFRQRVLGFLFVWTILALWPFIGFGEVISLRYTYLATMPFIAFLACAAVCLVKNMPRIAMMPAGAILTMSVIAALVITPFRTQDQQAFILRQAGQHEAMLDAVRTLCGPMLPDTQVYIKNAPLLDFFRVVTPSVVNLYYDDVYAYAVYGFPGLIAFVENKCALEYDRESRTYGRVTEF